MAPPDPAKRVASSSKLSETGRLSASTDTRAGMPATDEQLVERSIGGDLDSFNQLVLRWERPIYALAYRVLGREEDARDVTQEAFLRAFRSLPGFKGQAKFSSWLYRIALNLCHDAIRRERRAPFAPMPEDVDSLERVALRDEPESVEQILTRSDMGRRAAQAMDLLSDDQRTAIVLKEYQGLTFQEIAELLGCPVSTVKTRLYQGLTVLRRELERQGVTSELALGTLDRRRFPPPVTDTP